MSVMLPWVLPPIALALVWGWVLQAGNMGLVNSVLVQFGFQSVAWFGTKWAMVSIIFVTIWIGVPLSFMFEMASLQKIPEELYEAGSIDGTGFFQKLFYITIPLMKDTFRINLIMITIATIGYFDIIYAITEGGPNEMTEVLPMLTYHTAFKSSAMGKGAAISVTMLLISVLFCLLYIVIFHEKKGEE
jgi:ABC-type sugar transport system permease subunit